MSQTLSSSFTAWQASTVNSFAWVDVTLNNSPISSRLTQYPTIARDITDVVGATITIDIENASQSGNAILDDRTQLLKTVAVEYGYSKAIYCDGTYGWADGSGNWLIDGGYFSRVQLFGGKLTSVAYNGNDMSMTFADKFMRLNEKLIGTDKSPVSYINSNVNPADLWWWLVTSYGGLSTVASTTNTDIDYAAWQAWQSGFTGDSIVVRANYKGDKVLDAVDAICKLTDSAAFDKGDGHLTPVRWTGTMSYLITMSDSYFIGAQEATLTTDALVNKANIMLDYDVTSDSWVGQVTDQNSTSVNSYGLTEVNYDDTSVWYVTSLNAVNFAQRVVFRRKNPNLKMRVKTPLAFMQVAVGDNVNLTSKVFSLSGHNFLVRGFEINLNDRTMVFDLDEGFGRGAGTLQGFTLDDVTYGLLDQSYNALF